MQSTVKPVSSVSAQRTIRPFTSSSGNAVIRSTVVHRRRCQQCVVAALAGAFSGSQDHAKRTFATGYHSTNVQRTSNTSRRTSLIVRASWGAPVEFTAAKIVSNSKAAEMLHKIVIDVGDLAGGYTRGGQFMQIKVSRL